MMLAGNSHSPLSPPCLQNLRTLRVVRISANLHQRVWEPNLTPINNAIAHTLKQRKTIVILWVKHNTLQSRLDVLVEVRLLYYLPQRRRRHFSLLFLVNSAALFMAGKISAWKLQRSCAGMTKSLEGPRLNWWWPKGAVDGVIASIR